MHGAQCFSLTAQRMTQDPSPTWSLIEQVFHRINEAPKPEQARLLDAEVLLTEDQKKQVRALLAAADESAHWIDDIGLPKTNQDGSWAGSEIGDYVLEERIGTGGMGDVYKAHRKDQYAHWVAIKVMRMDGLLSASRWRFEQERQILARLRHPHIAQFYDAGQRPDGLSFLTMELIEGEPIHTYCARHNVSLVGRIQLVLQICAAIQYAHNELVVHRDLKPANVLVTQNGDAKVLDFGISKLLQQDQEAGTKDSPLLSQPYTLNYASPEQLTGQSVTIKTDVYALGVLLYQLVTHELPHQLANLSLDEIIAQLQVRPAAPSQSKAGATYAWGGRAKRDLDLIIFQAMAAQPEQRFATVQALQNDLTAWLNGQTVSVRPASVRYTLSRFLARNRWTSLLGGLLFVAIAIGFGLYVRQSEQVRQQAEKAGAITEYLEDLLSGYDPFDPSWVQQDSTETTRLIRNGLRHLRTIPDEAPDVRARILNLLARIASARNLRPLADSLATQAWLLAQKPPVNPEVQSAILYQKATLSLMNKQLPEGIRQAKMGLSLIRESTRKASEQKRNLLNILSELYMSRGELDLAAPLLTEAQAIAENLYNNQSIQYGDQLSQSAMLHFYRKEPEKGVAAMQSAIRVYQRHYSADAPYFSTLYNNLGVMLQDAKRLPEARQAQEKALQITMKTLGPYSRDALEQQGNLGTLYYELGDLKAAEQLYQALIPLAERYAPSQVSGHFQNYASVLSSMERHEEAEHFYRKSYLLRVQEVIPTHPVLLMTELSWGDELRMLGQWAAAEARYRQIMEKTAGQTPPHRRYVRALMRIGWIRLDQNKIAEAEQILQRVQALLPGLGEAPASQAEAKALSGFIQIAKGGREEGLSRIQQAITVLPSEIPRHDPLFIELNHRYRRVQEKPRNAPKHEP